MVGIPDPDHVTLLSNEVPNPSGTCVIAFHPGVGGCIARVKRHLPKVIRPQYVVAWYWATTFAQFIESDGSTYVDAMDYLQKYAKQTIDAPNSQSITSRKVSSAHKRMAQALQLEDDSILFCITDEKVRVHVPDHISACIEWPPHALLAMALTELITNRAEEALNAMATAEATASR